MLATFSAMALMLVVANCGKNPVDGNNDYPPLRPNLAISPYSSPIWHPDGEVIAFNHTPLKRIWQDTVDGLYNYEFYDDSSGFWLIDVDGTNQRRVYHRGLVTPAWSTNGEWVAFGQVEGIFKIRFTGEGFDTLSLTQLTFDGGYPAWCPDDQWIAYSNTIGDTVGVWISPADGSGGKSYFALGGDPEWFPDGLRLAYACKGIWVEALDHSYKIQIYSNVTNRLACIKVSPDGNNIAFVMQQTDGGSSQIWLMKIDGTNIRQLTTEGVGTAFSWSPDGNEIAYLSFRFADYTYANGTLWILNLQTGQKRQLTFNTPAP